MAEIATGSREDALDILQDAMSTLVEKYRDRTAADWGPLFRRILQSRIEDWRRRESVRRRFRVWFGSGADEHEEDPLQAVGDAGEPGPERRVQADRTIAVLDAAIRRLPLRQQQALLLRIWDGLDVGDTARAMRCSEGSVKTHYARAVAALRAQLEGHWP
jgi:RNA polymerase sigma-70 factor (ECF subfamily)